MKRESYEIFFKQKIVDKTTIATQDGRGFLFFI